VPRRARGIPTPSAYLAKAIEPYGFQARVIPNAIDLQNYPFQLRRQLQPRLLWMRTFHEIYNPQMAVDVLKRLKETYPHATLTMAGQEKGLLEPTRAYTRELGLEDHVSFTGFLNMGDKQRVFPAHDIYLNTTRVDNMPVSVVEAAAVGTPIVATAVGGVPFLLTDGENAFLVPDEDVSAMTQSICRLLASPELAAHFSRAGRTLAEASDWSQVLHQWEKTFTEVLRRR